VYRVKGAWLLLFMPKQPEGQLPLIGEPSPTEAVLGELLPVLLEASSFIRGDFVNKEKTESGDPSRRTVGAMPTDLYAKFAVTTANYLVQEGIAQDEDRQAKIDYFLSKISEGIQTTLTLNFVPSVIIETANNISVLRGFSERVIPVLNDIASDPERVFGLIKILSQEDPEAVESDDEKAGEALRILYAFNGFDRVQYSDLDLASQLEDSRFDSYIAEGLIETVMSHDPSKDNQYDAEIRKMVHEHTQILASLGLEDVSDLYKRLSSEDVLLHWRDKAKRALTERKAIYAQDMSYSKQKYEKFLKAHGCERPKEISEDKIVAQGISILIKTAERIKARTSNSTRDKIAATNLVKAAAVRQRRHASEMGAKNAQKPKTAETQPTKPNTLLMASNSSDVSKYGTDDFNQKIYNYSGMYKDVPGFYDDMETIFKYLINADFKLQGPPAGVVNTKVRILTESGRVPIYRLNAKYLSGVSNEEAKDTSVLFTIDNQVITIFMINSGTIVNDHLIRLRLNN
jgi:hypothetical protein